MAVKIGLKRLGKIRAPDYRIVVADSRTKRDGRVIEEIGKITQKLRTFRSSRSTASVRCTGSAGVHSPPRRSAALLKLTGDWGKHTGVGETESRVQVPEAKVAFEADTKKKPVPRPKAEKPAEAPAEEAPAEAPAEAAEEGLLPG